MIKEADLKRFYFELDEETPVQVLLNRHEEVGEGWFDMHYELELGVVVEGRMVREYFGHKEEIGPGDIWLCNMWEPHGFEIVEAPCEVVVFVVDPKYGATSHFLNKDISRAFMAPPSERPRTLSNSKQEMKGLAKKIQMQFSEDDDPDWAKLYFFQTMLSLIEKWEPQSLMTGYGSRTSIQGALRLIFRERRLITTKEAASVCNMSVTKFTALFKDLMGSTFSDFALQYRIKGAASQLKNSDLTQAAVALNWGFTDASHLHKHLYHTVDKKF